MQVNLHGFYLTGTVTAMQHKNKVLVDFGDCSEVSAIYKYGRKGIGWGEVVMGTILRLHCCLYINLYDQLSIAVVRVGINCTGGAVRNYVIVIINSGVQCSRLQIVNSLGTIPLI